MKLSYLKQVIKEEIEKALAEAETKDPGLNQKDFPETFRVVNKIADFLKSNGASRVNINPEIAASKIIEPQILICISREDFFSAILFSNIEKIFTLLLS